jgi:nucleoside-diphosphate-sugar epimerase
MKRVVLITGGNGCVGRAVVEQIFEAHGPAEVILLIRLGGPALPTAWRDMPVQIVEGDITLPSLGLPDSAVNRLRQRINTVIHAAADTRLTAFTRRCNAQT